METQVQENIGLNYPVIFKRIKIPTQPSSTGVFTSTGWIHDIHVVGDIVYVFGETSFVNFGLLTLNISDPPNLVSAGLYDSLGGIYDVCVAEILLNLLMTAPCEQ